MPASCSNPLAKLPSPAERAWLAAVVCLGLANATIISAEEGVDIVAVVRQLGHDNFTVRQRAERQLAAIGREIVGEAFAGLPPVPDMPYGSDFSAYFDRASAAAEAALQKRLYDEVPAGLDREARFRLAHLRRGLTEEIDERILKIRAKYPMQLPEEQAKLVEGFTGGFRGLDERRFDASYRNGSAFAVTAVRVRLRMSRKGKSFDHEIQLGPSARPILPGESVSWSADVEKPEGSSYELFWQTVAVYGYAIEKKP